MILVYVAGPYRAKTAWGIECNIHRARCVGVEVARLGLMPVIPRTSTAHLDVVPDDFWLEGTLELMRRCDALITVDGWYESSGSRREVATMNDMNRPTFHSLAELARWAKQQEK